MEILLYILYFVLIFLGAVILLLLLFILFGSADILFRYEPSGRTLLKVKALFITYTVFDSAKQKKDRKKPPDGEEKKEEKPSPLGEGIIQKIKTVFEILSAIRLRITVRKFYFSAEHGGEDAAKTALDIGGMYAALYGALGSLQKAVYIKKPFISIKPVYTEKIFRCSADIVLSFNMLSLAITAIKILCILRGVKNKSKKEREVAA